MEWIRACDVFDKFGEEEYRKKSVSGSLLSVVFLCGFAILLALGLADIATPVRTREVGVRDQLQSQTLINISLSARVSAPCGLLVLRDTDTLGFSRLFASSMSLRRYRNGELLSKHSLPVVGECPPCGPLRPAGECCHSCDELQLLHIAAEKEFVPGDFIQCRWSKADARLDEECLVKGKLTVNKVPGQIEIGFRRDYYDHVNYSFPPVNLTHSIERLRFGPKLWGTTTPLDLTQAVQEDEGHIRFQYELVITPVDYLVNGRWVDQTFEYVHALVAQDVRRVGAGWEPGVFFAWEFSPYVVRVQERHKALSVFIGRTLGIFSAVFLLTSLAESCFGRKETALK